MRLRMKTLIVPISESQHQSEYHQNVESPNIKQKWKRKEKIAVKNGKNFQCP